VLPACLDVVLFGADKGRLSQKEINKLIEDAEVRLLKPLLPLSSSHLMRSVSLSLREQKFASDDEVKEKRVKGALLSSFLPAALLTTGCSSSL
jgi:hypothetical protein